MGGRAKLIGGIIKYMAYLNYDIISPIPCIIIILTIILLILLYYVIKNKNEMNK